MLATPVTSPGTLGTHESSDTPNTRVKATGCVSHGQNMYIPWNSHHTGAMSEHDQCYPIPRMEFAQETVDIGTRGGRAEHEVGGNLVIGQPAGHQCERLPLPPRESGDDVRSGSFRSMRSPSAADVRDQRPGVRLPVTRQPIPRTNPARTAGTPTTMSAPGDDQP